MLELAHPLDAVPEPSPLAEARERHGLSVTQVAYRTGLSEEQIEWLEEGRLYRFASQNQAILSGIVYATAVGIDRFEARRIAGLPLTGTVRVNAKARLIVVAALAALIAALAVMVLAPDMRMTRTKIVEAIPNANLTPPWKLRVTVENGSGDINWTRTLASRIGAMGYTISKVGRADRFNYQSSTVYYGPGGQDVGVRLARQLDVAAQAAPGLTARQLLVVAGPRTAANS
jgi:transcriptional regulator with XRE-family HTH domain